MAVKKKKVSVFIRIFLILFLLLFLASVFLVSAFTYLDITAKPGRLPTVAGYSFMAVSQKSSLIPYDENSLVIVKSQTEHQNGDLIAAVCQNEKINGAAVLRITDNVGGRYICTTTDGLITTEVLPSEIEGKAQTVVMLAGYISGGFMSIGGKLFVAACFLPFLIFLIVYIAKKHKIKNYDEELAQALSLDISTDEDEFENGYLNNVVQETAQTQIIEDEEDNMNIIPEVVDAAVVAEKKPKPNGKFSYLRIVPVDREDFYYMANRQTKQGEHSALMSDYEELFSSVKSKLGTDNKNIVWYIQGLCFIGSKNWSKHKIVKAAKEGNAPSPKAEYKAPDNTVNGEGYTATPEAEIDMAAVNTVFNADIPSEPSVYGALDEQTNYGITAEPVASVDAPTANTPDLNALADMAKELDGVAVSENETTAENALTTSVTESGYAAPVETVEQAEYTPSEPSVYGALDEHNNYGITAEPVESVDASTENTPDLNALADMAKELDGVAVSENETTTENAPTAPTTESGYAAPVETVEQAEYTPSEPSVYGALDEQNNYGITAEPVENIDAPTGYTADLSALADMAKELDSAEVSENETTTESGYAAPVEGVEKYGDIGIIEREIAGFAINRIAGDKAETDRLNDSEITIGTTANEDSPIAEGVYTAPTETVEQYDYTPSEPSVYKPIEPPNNHITAEPAMQAGAPSVYSSDLAEESSNAQVAEPAEAPKSVYAAPAETTKQAENTQSGPSVYKPIEPPTNHFTAESAMQVGTPSVYTADLAYQNTIPTQGSHAMPAISLEELARAAEELDKPYEAADALAGSEAAEEKPTSYVKVIDSGDKSAEISPKRRKLLEKLNQKKVDEVFEQIKKQSEDL